MLKGAFVGFGRMGITHFSILNTNPSVHVVAISEPSSVMRSVLKKYLSVNLYSDYKKMLDAENVDFVVISTPPDSHAEIINEAIDRKIAFFVEKPLSLKASESQSIVEKLNANSVVNQVGYVNRFCETFKNVKAMLDAKVLGELKCFSSEMYSATVLKDTSSGWRGKKKAGGGCLYEMTSHAVDLAVYLFGAPIFVKGSMIQGIYSSQIDDFVSTSLQYENGINGRVVVNWSDASYRKPGNIITINGKKGKIIVSKYSIKVFMLEDVPSFELKKGWNTIFLTDISENVEFYLRGNEFTTQLYDFVDCVLNSKETHSTCHDSMVVDQVLEAISRDAEQNAGELINCSDANNLTETVSCSLLSRIFSK